MLKGVSAIFYCLVNFFICFGFNVNGINLNRFCETINFSRNKSHAIPPSEPFGILDRWNRYTPMRLLIN